MTKSRDQDPVIPQTSVSGSAGSIALTTHSGTGMIAGMVLNLGSCFADRSRSDKVFHEGKNLIENDLRSLKTKACKFYLHSNIPGQGYKKGPGALLSLCAAFAQTARRSAGIREGYLS